MVPVVLCVNHLEPNCGVYQFFKRLTTPLQTRTTNYTCYYIETNQQWECDYWIEKLKPSIVVYNFYYSGVTMPWLTNQYIINNRGKFKQIGLHHEGDIKNKGFDLILHQNPTQPDIEYFNLPRPIPEYNPFWGKINVLPTFGSFGFGLGGKGFTRLVEKVIEAYKDDGAAIRLNIPFAHFGDKDGQGARWWAKACYDLVLPHPLIDLTVTHALLSEDKLLDFLYANDCNCFLYDDNKGRGLSGTTDYALAVRKPIAITKSDQFIHLWTRDDRMLIEHYSLREIINNGAEYLQQFHNRWNTQTLIESFEHAFALVLKG